MNNEFILHLKSLWELGFFRSNNCVLLNGIDKIQIAQHSYVFNNCCSIDDGIAKVKITDFLQHWFNFLWNIMNLWKFIYYFFIFQQFKFNWMKMNANQWNCRKLLKMCFKTARIQNKAITWAIALLFHISPDRNHGTEDAG